MQSYDLSTTDEKFNFIWNLDPGQSDSGLAVFLFRKSEWTLQMITSEITSKARRKWQTMASWWIFLQKL